MPEYIERKALMIAYEKSLHKDTHKTFDASRIHAQEHYHIMNIIQNAPAADVVEVRHGKWSKRGNEKTCSECRFIYYSNNDEWNFCPNCGAKMDGKDDMK